MATKKVLVEINVEQKGGALDKTTKEVEKLTDVEKERLRIKRETKKIDAKLAVANEKETKALLEKKKALLSLNNSEKISASLAKKIETQRKASIKSTLAQADAEFSNKNAIDRQRQAALKAMAANNQYINSQGQLANATEEASKKLNEMKTTAGLSGAIVTEFGRTVSDLPYGIRGVGNNLSQLGTLFGLFSVNVAKSGRTMKQGFAEIFQQFKGIIGIMTAFQVVIALLQSQWFQKWAEGLFNVNKQLALFNDLMSETATIASSSISKFNIYTKTITDATSSIKEKEAALKLLNDEYPDFNANILTDKNNTEKATVARDAYIKKLEEQATTQAAISLTADKRAEILKEQAKVLADLNNVFAAMDFAAATDHSKAFNEVTKQGILDNIDYTKSIENQSDEFNKFFKRTENSTDDYGASITSFLFSLKDSSKEISKTQKEIDEIYSFINLGSLPDDLAKKSGSLKRGFKSRLLDLQTLAEKFRQESLKAEVKTDEELIREKAEFSKVDLSIKLDNYIETEKLRLKEFLITKGLSDKQKLEAKKSSGESIERAKEDSKIVLANIEAVYDAEINLLRRKEGEKARAESEARDRAEALKGAGRGGEGVLGFNQGFVDAQNQRIQNEIDYQNRLLEATQKGTLERSQAEQSYYDANNQMIQFNLEQEKLAAEEKQRVNNEYISYLSGLSSILGAITNKNKEWQKAALITEKAAAIGGVVTAAAKSIGVSTAATAAANQQIVAKYAAIPGGQIPAALEIKANTSLYRKGVANTKIGAGLSIAAITAGAISGVDAISTGGSSGSVGTAQTVQPPDFNIVGSTGVNQLADAIGSTETPIVKAVVVASEVTTQQALDRNTRTSAEL